MNCTLKLADAAKRKYLCDKYKHAWAYSVKDRYLEPNENKVKLFDEILRQVPGSVRHTVRVWGNNFCFSVGYVEGDVLVVYSKNGVYKVRYDD